MSLFPWEIRMSLFPREIRAAFISSESKKIFSEASLIVQYSIYGTYLHVDTWSVWICRFCQKLKAHADELVYVLENELGILGIDGVLAYFSCPCTCGQTAGSKQVFILQRWSEKWKSFVDVTDVDQVFDGDHLTIVMQHPSDTQTGTCTEVSGSTDPTASCGQVCKLLNVQNIQLLQQLLKVHGNLVISFVQKLIAVASKVCSDVKNPSQKHKAAMSQLFIFLNP